MPPSRIAASQRGCGYRADVVVCGRVIVEIKAIATIALIHDAVMLTYLRLSGYKIGLLIHFHFPVLKDGIRRCIWEYDQTAREGKAERRGAEDREKCRKRKSEF
jgi:hypothetical protein